MLASFLPASPFLILLRKTAGDHAVSGHSYRLDSGEGLPAFESGLCHFPAVWPWASYLTSVPQFSPLYNRNNNSMYATELWIKLVNVCKVLEQCMACSKPYIINCCYYCCFIIERNRARSQRVDLKSQFIILLVTLSTLLNFWVLITFSSAKLDGIALISREAV